MQKSDIKNLIAQMTLEEKASQLRYNAPAIDRLGIPAYNWWNEVLHGVARAGTATVFPQAIGLAAMFDEDLQEKIADVISDEARAKYNGQSRRDRRSRAELCNKRLFPSVFRSTHNIRKIFAFAFTAIFDRKQYSADEQHSRVQRI